MGKDAKFGIGIQISATDKASATIGKVAANAKKAAVIGSMSTERNQYKRLWEMESRTAAFTALTNKRMAERHAIGQQWASRLSGGAGSILGGIARGAAWAGGIAVIGTGVLAAFGQRIVKTVSELKDFSAQTGFNVEALQQWEFAASQAGVPIEELRSSIEKLSKGFGGLKGNKGPLYEFLRGKGDVGFIKQLKAAASAEVALDLLVRKMEKIPDEAVRATLATAAFGKAGGGMARLAVEGSAGLDKLRKRAVDLGLVLGADSVGSVKVFGDQLDEAKLAVGALGRDILVSLVPSLSSATDNLTDWIIENKKMIVGKGVEYLKEIGDGFKAIGEWLAKNRGALVTALEAIGSTFKFVAEHGELVKGMLLGLVTIFAGGKLVAIVGALAAVLPSLGIALGPSFIAALNPAVLALVAIGAALIAAKEAADAFDDVMQDSILDEAAKKMGVPAFSSAEAANKYMQERQETLSMAARDEERNSRASRAIYKGSQAAPTEVFATITVANAPAGTTVDLTAHGAKTTTIQKGLRPMGR